MDGPIDVRSVCALLRDPEIDVQNKAIDLVIKATTRTPCATSIDDAEGRERERAPRGGGGAERGRHAQLGEVPARPLKDSDWWVRSRAGGRARQDRRPQGHRGGAAAGARQGRGHPPRRHRDPEPDQGRARRRSAHPRHARLGLVGQRARHRCAGGNRQQARPAAPAGDAAGRAMSRRCRSWCAPSASSAMPSSSISLLPLLARPEREIRIEAIQALASSSTKTAPTSCAPSCSRQVERPRSDHGAHGRAAALDRTGSAILEQQLDAQAGPRPQLAPTRPGSHRAVADRRGSRAHAADLRQRSPRPRKQAAGGRSAAGYLDAQARRHHRGTLQVHRQASAAAPSAPCC